MLLGENAEKSGLQTRTIVESKIFDDFHVIKISLGFTELGISQIVRLITSDAGSDC